MKIISTGLALSMLLGTGLASAATYSFSGDTSLSATVFNRPTASGSMDVAGGNVPYEVLSFAVSAPGIYSFLSTANFDNFTFLYAGSFDPAASRNNFVVGNDDFYSVGMSGFDVPLSTGTTYYFVNAGIYANTRGAFTASITGPGAVLTALSPVPEPGSVAMLLSGMGLVASRFRRRQKPSVCAAVR